MRILVLGGSVFLSRAVAADAVRRGHEVVCACRGESGTVPDGATLVTWDRSGPVPTALADRSFDAMVDVARTPSWVRAAVTAWPGAHRVFVSTINAYADESTPGGRPGTLALREPQHDDVDPAADADAYGRMKVACEEIVGAASSWTVVRPGLIVGPDDPTGRFSYWPRRLAAGGDVLGPGDPGDLVQVIDVRDLAAWLVTCCESRTGGTYDGVGPAMPIGGLLAEMSPGAAVSWVDQDFLTEQGVQPWAGPASIPLWLPRPAYDGMLAHDVLPSLEAGLEIRPVADTARDTLAWLDADPEAPVDGIDLTRERELLDAWRP